MAMPSICFTAKVAKLLVLLTCVSAVPPGAQVANNAEENISIEEPLSRLIRNPASASNPAIRQLNSHIQEEFPESIVASGVSTENPGNAFLIKEIRNAFQQAMPIQSSKASRGSSALASSQGMYQRVFRRGTTGYLSQPLVGTMSERKFGEHNDPSLVRGTLIAAKDNSQTKGANQPAEYKLNYAAQADSEVSVPESDQQSNNRPDVALVDNSGPTEGTGIGVRDAASIATESSASSTAAISALPNGIPETETSSETLEHAGTTTNPTFPNRKPDVYHDASSAHVSRDRYSNDNENSGIVSVSSADRSKTRTEPTSEDTNSEPTFEGTETEKKWWQGPVNILEAIGNWVIGSVRGGGKSGDGNADTMESQETAHADTAARQASPSVSESEVNTLVDEIIGQVQLRTDQEFNEHKEFLEKEQGIAIRTADEHASKPQKLNMTYVMRTFFDRTKLAPIDQTEVLVRVVSRLSKMKIDNDRFEWQ